MTSDKTLAAPSRAVRLCGTEAADRPSRRLCAGPLAVELENGQLRYVRFGGVEVLRGIAFLVRDENWGTYAPLIENLDIQEIAESFAVSYRAVCSDARQRLAFEARITGSSDGSLDFTAIATPETDFVTNRAGFVVLHPADLAGEKLKVTHVDGSEEETRFPKAISPSQPVFNIRALAHEAAPGLWATCRMDGDAFEMEDQRNWTDASYKTYVRPLALPWGYTLAKGSRHEQSVRLSFSGRVDSVRKEARSEATVTLGADLPTRMPDLGVALPAEEAETTLAAIESLRAMRPRFLVCSVDLRDSHALAKFDAYRKASEAVSAPIVLEIIVPDEQDAVASLAPVAAAVRKAGLKLDSVVVSSAADLKSWQPGATRPEKPAVEEIFKAARAAFPGVRLGGGMLSTFTELNRKRPKPELVDYVTHTTCSIVHAADDRSVMETLETIPAIIASTRAMIGDRPYRIGPSAIGARSNPYGKGLIDNPHDERVCLTDRDPRQRGLFNAAWTLGYVAACACGGLEALSLGATTGPLGFIHRRGAAASPYFDSIDGPAVYPAFHVMAGLALGRGRHLVETRLSEPRGMAALAWREGVSVVMWLANLTAEPLTIGIRGLGRARLRASVLDASAFEQAVASVDALEALRRPLEQAELKLDAYAVARVEAENGQAS
jgi:D-apionolactonase